MLWTPHRITFRLLSPLHIGWRKSGNVQQTRSYVTGRTFWGALTARLTRDGNGNDYQTIGAAVDAQLAFTYFYPTTCPDKVSLFPWGASQAEFEWQFLHSYVSTAINADNAADESTLHETEFIAPHTRNNDPVYLLGYVFARDDCKLEWRDALKRLQFGGERGYGWGRVQAHSICDVVSDCFDYTFDLTAERPVLTRVAGLSILAHTRSAVALNGRVEVLLGRETGADTGFGGAYSEPAITWEPGSQSTEAIQYFKLKEKGVWEAMTQK